MNGPQSNQSCHFRVKTVGLCCATARQKHWATDVLWGLGDDSTSGKHCSGYFWNKNDPGPNTSPQSMEYDWGKAGSRAAKVTATKTFVLVIVRIDRWGNKDKFCVFFFLLDYYVQWVLPLPLLGEDWEKIHSTSVKRHCPLQKRLKLICLKNKSQGLLPHKPWKNKDI